LVPALKTRKPDCIETLKEGGREGSGTRHRRRVRWSRRRWLWLSFADRAGLMVRTLAALWNVNPGFEANKL